MEMTSAARLPDLERSWVVEASAGTGKTSALVRRIVEVIAAGTPVESIVAVTFTHAAAGNMKLRVRHQLELRGAVEADAAVRERLGIAARSLDRAFIGTIHAFCAQLLRRRPVEARVDPVFQELAQPDAMRVFGVVFRRWIERRLAEPSPALSRALSRLAYRVERDEGEPLDELRKAAWNLVEWRDFDAPWDKRPLALEAHMSALIDRAEAVLRIPSRGGRVQQDYRPLREFVLRVQRAREAGLEDAGRIESELLRLPAEMRWVKGKDALAAAWEELKVAIESFRQLAEADLAAHLRDELWEVVGLYQEEKKRAGQLDFMDLLLCARDLLRHDAARADLQRVYQRIFVDEFQDTDPLQAEILLLLAAADPRGARLAQSAARARKTLRGGRSEAIHLPLPARRCEALPPHLPRAARRRRGHRGAERQHALHARDPDLRQCGLRAHDRELSAVDGR